jgi:hypothetical protein
MKTIITNSTESGYLLKKSLNYSYPCPRPPIPPSSLPFWRLKCRKCELMRHCEYKANLRFFYDFKVKIVPPGAAAAAAGAAAAGAAAGAAAPPPDGTLASFFCPAAITCNK